MHLNVALYMRLRDHAIGCMHLDMNRICGVQPEPTARNRQQGVCWLERMLAAPVCP